MAHKGFDEKMAALDALKGLELDAEQRQFARKMLGNRSNLLMAKAARLAGDGGLAELTPDLIAAFDRSFIDAVKTDPGCWAKNALAKALVKLEHRGKDVYLRGMRHHQLEPVWGGQEDTAGALRSTCTHALVDCPGISDAELLTALLEPMTDTDKTVRIEAARAVAQVGGVSAALLLRLRALLGKDEPEVLGAVYSALLDLEGSPAIPLVAQHLEEGDEVSAEAAFALSENRSQEGLAALLARLHAGADAWFGSVLLSAVALTRLPEAIDYLMALIARDAREAVSAIEAIGRTAPNAELRARVEQAVEQADSPRLRQAVRQHLPAAPDAS